MASEVEICNIGMHRLGQDEITSLSDNTKRASLCFTAYPRLRDVMLSEYVWGFARARVNLTPNAVGPAFTSDFPYAFELPSDYLRLESLGSYGIDYLIEGHQILSSINPLPLRYIRQVTDPAQMSPQFRECLGLRLAVDLCQTLTGNGALKQQIQEELTERMQLARTTDAQSEGEGLLPDDTWIQARA